MALRAMNNKEKAAVALLKEKGFHIFWQYRNGERDGDYWATHHKLIGQYHVGTTTDEAIKHLEEEICLRHLEINQQQSLF